MPPLLWFSFSCLCWSAVALGQVWMIGPAALCAALGVRGLFAGTDDKEESC
jgi:hypothetical protein